MNTASNSELEYFEKSVAPETFELNVPSANVLLPAANASVSRLANESVKLDWSSKSEEIPPASPEDVLSEIERSVRRRVDRFPRSARAHANLGIALLRNDRAAEASAELETALELDPANYVARLTLARLHFEAGRLDKAGDCYRELLAHHPDNAAVSVALANVLIKLGRHAEAMKHLTEAARIDGHNPDIRFLLGLLCLQRSDLRCALNEFRAASHLDLRNPNIYHAIGVAYTLQGEHQRAEKAFKTALKLAPDSPQIAVSLARTLLAFQKFEQAIEILESYLSQHQNDLGVREQLALAFLQAGRFSAARHQLVKILEDGSDKLSPTDIARHHSNIAVSLMNERSFDKAKTELKLAITIAPMGSHITYENLARVYALTGKASLGIDVLRQSIEMFPSSIEVRSLLGILYAEQENYPEAIAQLETLQKLGPLSEDNYASLASYYAENGEFSKALDLLMEAYAKYPKSKPIINNLSYCLLMEGHIDQAKEVLESRPRNTEDHVELVATIGLLHLKQGDEDGARRLYKHAESMAIKSSRKGLARQVRQKMHLELAKFHIKKGDYASAKREIDAGLSEKRGRVTFLKQLENLARSLEDRTLS